MGPPKLPKSFLYQWRIGQNPTVDCAVIDLEAPLKEHALQIAVTQGIAQIPSHRLDDQPRLKVTPFEIVLRLASQILGNRIQNHRPAPQFRKQNRPWL
jgi:hypothetical protein